MQLHLSTKEIGLTKHTRRLLENPPKPYEEHEEEHEEESWSVTKLLRKYMPDFCWLTHQDLKLMLKQINPDFTDNDLYVAIHRLQKSKQVISKRWIHPTHPGTRGVKPSLYMRVY